MFDSIFAELDQQVGRKTSHYSSEEWKELSGKFLHYAVELDCHIPYVDVALNEKLLQRSMLEYYFHNNNGPGLCFSRIRPENEYYIKQGAKLPTPADPTGPSATGIEIGLGVYHGVEWDTGPRPGTRPPFVTFGLQIWGNREREAFRGLFQDYRRVIDLILSKVPSLEFFCSVPMDALEAYKGRDIAKKLDIYFSEDDCESMFELEVTYKQGVTEQDFFLAFRAFATLYLACLHRLTPRGNRDIILDYYRRIT